MESSSSERGSATITSQSGISTTMVSDADFHESVASHHRRINADEWKDIYLVGDVHGCPDELGSLIATIDPDPDDLLVFVGDLVRKGPDSKAVVEFVRRHDNMVSVRGNNEQKLIHGNESLASLDATDFAFLESLPVAISFEDSLVIHGGIQPERPLVEQDIESLLTCRSVPAENGYDGPFWFEQYQGPPQAFFGHTVLEKPFQTRWTVGLDTGCVYGGTLTAYDYYDDSFINVPANETYETRTDQYILNLDNLDA